MLAIKIPLVRAKTAKYFKSQEVDHKERKKEEPRKEHLFEDW